eukprot:CAMPEP_0194510654 /NCGR_PEP_ID=MMETSP0253-20130528/42055_1 /TAXON_ID=2966 /ORGANISM="Noctiluca scintillans" /LENGTH=131 /DNA_ID=CAMNT_0039353911 /DNA_START=80 /DNA_END=471 /DNA_ORIENTATION=+
MHPHVHLHNPLPTATRTKCMSTASCEKHGFASLASAPPPYWIYWQEEHVVDHPNHWIVQHQLGQNHVHRRGSDEVRSRLNLSARKLTWDLFFDAGKVRFGRTVECGNRVAQLLRRRLKPVATHNRGYRNVV